MAADAKHYDIQRCNAQWLGAFPRVVYFSCVFMKCFEHNTGRGYPVAVGSQSPRGNPAQPEIAASCCRFFSEVTGAMAQVDDTVLGKKRAELLELNKQKNALEKQIHGTTPRF